jgi:hypothetical protein
MVCRWLASDTETVANLAPLPVALTFRYRSRVKAWALMSWGSVVVCGSLFLGCQNYGDQVQRAQSYYERNQYEVALSVVRDMEAHRDSLTEVERVRYCYVRGMTDFRLGYSDDARYWLGLAKVSLKHAPSALNEDERSRVDESLDELNRPIYGITEAEQVEAAGQLSSASGR